MQLVLCNIAQAENKRTTPMATESHRVHIDASLYERATTIARKKGQSVESLIEDLLRERVSTPTDHDRSTSSADSSDDAVNEVWDRMSRSLQGGSDLGFGESRAA
jgi:hypothetical protein